VTPAIHAWRKNRPDSSSWFIVYPFLGERWEALVNGWSWRRTVMIPVLRDAEAFCSTMSATWSR
jgi:hypothetical protein